KHFHTEIVAAYTDEDVEQLKQNAGIIRNQSKIKATIKNASAVLELQREFGSFHRYLWEFAGRKQQVNHRTTHEEVPAETALSIDLSKVLKSSGSSLVDTVSCYSCVHA